MKIIGIVGILDFPNSDHLLWKNFRLAFKKQFPNATFVVERSVYLPWQIAKIKELANSIVEKYDTGEDVMLVGYSLGGIIACAIAPRFKESQVQCVVTISTPHGIRLFYDLLNAMPTILRMPVFTFAGIFDPVVPWFLTKYPNSIHTNLMSDHWFWYMWNKHMAIEIAQKVRGHLYKHPIRH